LTNGLVQSHDLLVNLLKLRGFLREVELGKLNTEFNKQTEGGVETWGALGHGRFLRWIYACAETVGRKTG
jgi:hypothetical protein